MTIGKWVSLSLGLRFPLKQTRAVVACGAIQVPGVLPLASSPTTLTALHPKALVYISYRCDLIGTKDF